MIIVNADWISVLLKAIHTFTNKFKWVTWFNNTSKFFTKFL